jgi:hypothetical protein
MSFERVERGFVLLEDFVDMPLMDPGVIAT